MKRDGCGRRWQSPLSHQTAHIGPFINESPFCQQTQTPTVSAPAKWGNQWAMKTQDTLHVYVMCVGGEGVAINGPQSSHINAKHAAINTHAARLKWPRDGTHSMLYLASAMFDLWKLVPDACHNLPNVCTHITRLLLARVAPCPAMAVRTCIRLPMGPA